MLFFLTDTILTQKGELVTTMTNKHSATNFSQNKCLYTRENGGLGFNYSIIQADTVNAQNI